MNVVCCVWMYVWGMDIGATHIICYVLLCVVGIRFQLPVGPTYNLLLYVMRDYDLLLLHVICVELLILLFYEVWQNMVENWAQKTV